ncbi:MAG TPA: sigma-70 family RNA polymerase sigma factor [Methylomirabilota bacterium]|nr:sigma-70 family RNA polymerase sigma factor [Methylomirabilota bacterium]
MPECLPNSRESAHSAPFGTTHWSVVLLAGAGSEPQAAKALEKLCHIYWRPLYAFSRRQGNSPEQAADLTQEFFAHLLATDALKQVSQERGKFRSFLLASFKNLASNEWLRSQRQKRGGGVSVLSLEDLALEEQRQQNIGEELTPEMIFDRSWAEAILAQALARLRAECDSDLKARRFDDVKLFLLGEQGDDSMAAAAERLQMSLSAIKALVHRLRQRFRELVRHEIAQTVGTRAELDEEIRYFCAVFGS